MNLKPHTLLDELKRQKKIRSDRQLADLLNVAPPVISKMRNGTLQLGDTLRVRIMRTVGWDITLIDHLAPPEAA